MSNNLVPVGTYQARIVGDIQYGVTKKGGDYIRTSFSLETGDGPRLLTKDFHFTDTTAERSLESLRFCGWVGNDLNVLSVGVDGLGDSVVSVTVEHENWTDDKGVERTVAKVGWVNANGGGAKITTPMSDGQRKAFGQRMKGLAMKIPASPAATPAKPNNGRPQPPRNAGDAWEDGPPEGF